MPPAWLSPPAVSAGECALRTAAALVNQLVEAQREQSLSRMLARWSRVELIVIDERAFEIATFGQGADAGGRDMRRLSEVEFFERLDPWQVRFLHPQLDRAFPVFYLRLEQGLEIVQMRVGRQRTFVRGQGADLDRLADRVLQLIILGSQLGQLPVLLSQPREGRQLGIRIADRQIPRVSVHSQKS